MKMKFTYFFFWTVGFLCIYYPIKIAMTNKYRILLVNYENPIILYSPVLFSVFLSIVLLLTPVLIHLNIISSDYYGADKYSRAKSEFIVISLSIPGWIFFCISVIYIKGNIWVLIIFMLLILYKYISSINVLLKKEAKDL